MSWTSEFELPPSGPSVPEGDDGAQPANDGPSNGQDGSDQQTDGAGGQNGMESDHPEGLDNEDSDHRTDDLPDEGPLDPSVFDGLFADLADPEPEPVALAEVETEVEEVETETNRELLDPDVSNPDLSDAGILADLDPVEADLDQGQEPTDFVQPSEFDSLTDLADVDQSPGPVVEALDDAGPGDEPWYDNSPLDANQITDLGDLLADDSQAGFENFEDEPEEPEAESEEFDHLVTAETEDPVQHEDAVELEDAFVVEDPAELEHAADVEDLADLEDEFDVEEGFDVEDDFDVEEPAELEDASDIEDPAERHGPAETGDAVELEGSVQQVEDRERIAAEDPVGRKAETEPEPPSRDPFRLEADKPAEHQGNRSGGALADFTPLGRTGQPQLPPLQPVPVATTSPPIALDEPEHDIPAIVHHTLTGDLTAVPAAQVVDRVHPPVDPPTKRRWPAFATAIVVGGILGIGGALTLTNFRDNPEDQGTSSINPSAAADPLSPQEQQTDSSGEPQPIGQTSPSLVVDGGMSLSSIEFIAGTADLTAASQTTLTEVAAALVEIPPEPLAVTVRSFTEPSPEANRDLSTQQAITIVDYLETLGVQTGGLTVRGLGAAPLDQGLPVANFVVPTTSLGARDLQTELQSIGPFDIGIVPRSQTLRPESVAALDRITAAMAGSGASVTLAGYAYDQPDDQANRMLANAAVEAARAYLNTTGQIDPSRISVLTPGPLPYAIGPDQGGHVEIKWGRSVAVDVAIHSGEPSTLAFGPGADALSAAAIEELGRIATLLTDSDASAVFGVRATGEATEADNVRLSERRAETILTYLTNAGLGQPQVRAYGLGDAGRLPAESDTGAVTVTVIP